MQPHRQLPRRRGRGVFFLFVKKEMCHQQKFATRADAKHAVIDYIERSCNRFRPQSAIDGQAPAEKMASFFERTARVVELDVGSVEKPAA